MTTNKERIENLEKGVGDLHDEVQRLGVGMNDRLQRLEKSIKTLSVAVLPSGTNHSLCSVKHGTFQQHLNDAEITRQGFQNFPLIRTKIEFP